MFGGGACRTGYTVSLLLTDLELLVFSVSTVFVPSAKFVKLPSRYLLILFTDLFFRSLRTICWIFCNACLCFWFYSCDLFSCNITIFLNRIISRCITSSTVMMRLIILHVSQTSTICCHMCFASQIVYRF